MLTSAPAAAASAAAGPLGWASLGANVLGGLFGGLGASSAQKQQMGLQQTEFKVPTAYAMQRNLELNPLRDRLIYNLTQRAGLPQQSLGINFDPSGKFQGLAGSQEQQQGQLAQRLGQYTPGAGGTNPWFTGAILNSLGFDPGNVQNWNNPAGGQYYSPKGGVMPGGRVADPQAAAAAQQQRMQPALNLLNTFRGGR